MFSVMILVHIWWISLISTSFAFPLVEESRADFGLAHTATLKSLRERYSHNLDENSKNSSDFISTYLAENINVTILIQKESLKLYDNGDIKSLSYSIHYTSSKPLALSYDLDSTSAVELMNMTWLWLPAATKVQLNTSLFIKPKRLGISYLTFWIREAKPAQGLDVPTIYPFDNIQSGRQNYFDSIILPVDGSDAVMGFPVTVIRTKGTLQLVFRIAVILMVTIFTFTMGCGLDPKILKSYFKKPIAPAIGFICQFTLMPIIAFGIAKLIPIQPQFGFGLLTVGCSPGGGASNAWSLMLGGDINLSMLMTFVSSLCALFMMPLWLLAFARFFISYDTVTIPYGNIMIQLLQVAIPASLGLGFRIWKPHLAMKCMKLTRPIFVFFMLFFLTFGVYVNWSILSLIATYPIVIPASALLPWTGFALAILVGFILRQPRTVIITIALETGIQNVGVSILVLLYSMPQPDGDLGAIMPISVSMFTPIPLALAYLGLIIHRRCSSARKKKTYAIPQDEGLERLKGTNANSTNGEVVGAAQMSSLTAPNTDPSSRL